MLIPAIDLKDGVCVRLLRGDMNVVKGSVVGSLESNLMASPTSFATASARADLLE